MSPEQTRASPVDPGERVVAARWMTAESSRAPSATMIGGLHGTMPVLVDGAGLVSPVGASWSLDWWIGGDDRWYFPSLEAAVRQRRLGVGPVVETAMRIPSGDAVAKVYGARSSAAAGDAVDVTVVEITNDSPVPVALAVAIRPYTAWGPVDDNRTLAPVDETTVTIGADHVLRLPRPVGQAGSSVEADMASAVRNGRDLSGLEPVSGPSANAVVLYPLPHRTSLRFVIGPAGRSAGVHPESLPDADQVSRGWTSVVHSGTRLSTPDSGIDALVDAARARLLIYPDDVLAEFDHAIVGDGDTVGATAGDTGRSGAGGGSLKRWFSGRRRSPGRHVCVGGAGEVAAALAVGGHFDDVERLVSHLADEVVGDVSSAAVGARLVAGAAVAAALWTAEDAERARPSVEALLEPLTNVVRLVERSVQRQTGETADNRLAFAGLALVVEVVGQRDAALALRQRLEGWRPEQDQTLTLGRVADLGELASLAEQASEALSWSDRESDRRSDSELGPEPGRLSSCGRSPAVRADSVAGAARFVLAARSMILAETLDGTIELLPRFPAAWRGGQVEIHEAPTLYGRLSFAVRWHGPRPAVLWDMAVSGPLAERFTGLRCTALDPDWSSPSAAGETLLAGTGDGLEPVPGPGDSFA